MDTLKTMVGVYQTLTHNICWLAYTICTLPVNKNFFFTIFVIFFRCVAHVHISTFSLAACVTNSTN